MRKILLATAVTAALANSAMADMNTSISVGAGIGHINGHKGVLAFGSAKHQINNDWLGKVTLDSASIKAEAIHGFPDIEWLNIKAPEQLLVTFGTGFQSWKHENSISATSSASVPSFSPSIPINPALQIPASTGAQSTEEKSRRALYSTAGLMTKLYLPYGVVFEPRAFLLGGLGDFNFGAGAGLGVEYAIAQDVNVFLDFESKNLNTSDGSKNTSRSVLGVSYRY